MIRVLLVWSANPFCTENQFGMKQRVRGFLDQLALRGYKIDQFRSGNYATANWSINPYGVVLNPPENQTLLKATSHTISLKSIVARFVPKAWLPKLVELYQKVIKPYKTNLQIEFSDYAAVIFVTSGAISQFDYLDQVTACRKILLFERSEATWNSFGNETGNYFELLEVEKNLSSKMNEIIHISVEEQSLFDNLVPEVESYLFPPSYRLPSVTLGVEKRYDFLLFGHDHENNLRGAKEFLSLLSQQKSQYKVLIAGAMAKKLRKLNLNNLFFEEQVDNLVDLYSSVSISVSFAAVSDGVKTKVIESFAHGIPVLANKQGASGLVNKRIPGLYVVSEAADAFAWVDSILGSRSNQKEIAKILQTEVSNCYSEKNIEMAAGWVGSRIIRND